jgi:hypothetical protein
MPTKSSADKLLDELIQNQQLITYKAAYPILIGPLPNRFASRHGSEVAHKAFQSKEIEVEGLRIRLDSLIVLQATGEPSDSHFEGKSYTRTQWQSVFGKWEVIRPSNQ